MCNVSGGDGAKELSVELTDVDADELVSVLSDLDLTELAEALVAFSPGTVTRAVEAAKTRAVEAAKTRAVEAAKE